MHPFSERNALHGSMDMHDRFHPERCHGVARAIHETPPRRVYGRLLRRDLPPVRIILLHRFKLYILKEKLSMEENLENKLVVFSLLIQTGLKFLYH